MKRTLGSHLGAMARGLALGSVLGAVHAFVLGQGGLYATAEPLAVLISTARYIALMALMAAAFTAVGGLLTVGVRAMGLAGIRGTFPGATSFLAAYAVGWALLHAREARVQGMPSLIWAVGFFAVALGLGLAAWRGLRRAPRGPAADLLRPAEVWLVTATLGVHVAILMLTAGGIGLSPESTMETGPTAALGRPPLARSSTADAVADDAHRERTNVAGSISPPRRNLLLLSFDTLRADHMGCYGYPRNTSPALDSLATAGALFANVLCQRPKTSPSVATLLTGTYPVTHGIHAPLQVLAPENLTLAEILQQEGWTTGAVITNGNLYPPFGFDQGFATYVFGHKDAETGSDEALAWLDREATGETPWFLWVHHTDPHWPYEPDPPFDEIFGRGSAETGRGQRHVDLYDGEIRYTDLHAGRILRWLRERPTVRDRTLVVFTADHGESLGEHDYYWEHGLHPYEPSARIPLLMSLPGVLPPGRTVEALGAAVDIVPSVLELVGVPSPPNLQGASLAPLARGEDEEGPQEFVFLEAGYGEHIGPGRTQALRRLDRKYVLRLKDWALFPRGPMDLLWTMDACMEGGLGPDELYDLDLDPGETLNLLQARRVQASEDRALLRAFVAHLASAARGGRAVDPSQLDAATYESLKSLGYID